VANNLILRDTVRYRTPYRNKEIISLFLFAFFYYA